MVRLHTRYPCAENGLVSVFKKNAAVCYVINYQPDKSLAVVGEKFVEKGEISGVTETFWG